MKDRFNVIVIALVAILVSTAIFVKPRERVTSLFDADKLVAGASASGIWDTRFAEKVMNTVFFGLVLTKDEYTIQNAEALQALRSWAAQEFHKDPRFLHPVILPSPVANSTYINASVYSAFAAPYYSLRAMTGDLMKWRMEAYAQSKSFKTFFENCYDYFGREPETASLIARYQSDRAELAINPLLSLLYFGFFTLLAPLVVPKLALKAAGWRAPFLFQDCGGSPRLAAAVGYSFAVTALFYFFQSVVEEGLAGQSLLAAACSGLVSLFLLFPIKISIDGENIHVLRSGLRDQVVKTVLFGGASLVVIQALNWLKQGGLTSPDPLTLLISAFVGDFLHEPVQAKKTVALVISALWAAGFAFTLRSVLRRGGVSTAEVTKRLAENSRVLK